MSDLNLTGLTPHEKQAILDFLTKTRKAIVDRPAINPKTLFHMNGACGIDYAHSEEDHDNDKTPRHR